MGEEESHRNDRRPAHDASGDRSGGGDGHPPSSPSDTGGGGGESSGRSYTTKRRAISDAGAVDGEEERALSAATGVTPQRAGVSTNVSDKRVRAIKAGQLANRTPTAESSDKRRVVSAGKAASVMTAASAADAPRVTVSVRKPVARHMSTSVGATVSETPAGTHAPPSVASAVVGPPAANPQTCTTAASS